MAKMQNISKECLIAYSGGLSSRVLIDLVQSQSQWNPIFSSFRIVRVLFDGDENVNLSDEQSGVEVVLIKGSDYCDTEVSVKSTTSRKTIKAIQLLKVLTTYADASGIDTILLGTSGTMNAINTLSYITLGYGEVLHDLVSLQSTINQKQVLRALKDLSTEELQIYANLRGLDYEKEQKGSDNSIQATIEGFITSIAPDFPSTVSTINRVTNRIGVNTSDISCSVCDLQGKSLCYGCSVTLKQ
jgi:tRNA(Ile)-lysidine synthase TilS/MesJ